MGGYGMVKLSFDRRLRLQMIHDPHNSGDHG
jgi:hypothetical protein